MYVFVLFWQFYLFLVCLSYFQFCGSVLSLFCLFFDGVAWDRKNKVDWVGRGVVGGSETWEKHDQCILHEKIN